MDNFKTIENNVSLFLKAGELNDLEEYLSLLPEKSRNLVILSNLIKIFHEEVAHDSSKTIFDYSLNLGELVNHYMIVKLLLRRLEFDFPKEYQEELYNYCTETGVSSYFISHIINNNIFRTDEVIEKVEKIFTK